MFTLIMTNSIPRYSMKKYDFPAFFSESRKSGETELPAFGCRKEANDRKTNTNWEKNRKTCYEHKNTNLKMIPDIDWIIRLGSVFFAWKNCLELKKSLSFDIRSTNKIPSH